MIEEDADEAILASPDTADAASVYFDAWIVHGKFEPCPAVIDWRGQSCDDQERFIEFVPTNSGKRLICGRNHRLAFEGKTWIPLEEFGPDGSFHDVLPDELCPSETELRARRWNPPKATKRRLEHQQECLKCDAPPLLTWRNSQTDNAWQWLTEHDREVIQAIHSELRGIDGPVDLAEWYEHLSTPMRKRVCERFNLSALENDHGIPRKVANERWYELSKPTRKFLQGDLIFKICRKCNGTKGSKLHPPEELLELYAKQYFHGSEVAARADARFALFEEVLAVFYGISRTG